MKDKKVKDKKEDIISVKKILNPENKRQTEDRK